LAEVSGELATRLSTLQANAAQVGDAAIARRAQVAPPVIDPNAGFAKVRAAREAAVRARRETNTAVRAQLAAAKSQLQKLTSQLLADEQAIAAALAAPPPPPVAAAPPPRAVVPSAAAVMAEAPAAKKPQRSSPRVKMQATVDFNSDDNFYAGFSANISDGGLFVATVNLLPLGTEVDLSFTLPSGQRIEAKGRVSWVREVNDKLPDAFPGMGVQFVGLSPAAHAAIGQFLAQRDPLFYADAE
jgi:uncharacterized protein (TIGR02266 family)